jgi:WD40 repeat protein
LAGTLQSPQSLDGSGQFHPIVGRIRHPTLQHALVLTAPQDARPTSGTRVSEARTVSDDLTRPPFRLSSSRDASGSFWLAVRNEIKLRARPPKHETLCSNRSQTLPSTAQPTAHRSLCCNAANEGSNEEAFSVARLPGPNRDFRAKLPVVPLPIATIGLSLAAAGLKIFGGESKLLEFAAHPLDVAAGHLGAENILELAERLRKWYDGNERIENEDLEKAVARSALLADLFCLRDALPPQAARLGPWSQLRDHFKEWLPDRSLQGIFSRAEESAIRSAIEACEKRLKEIKEGTFVPAGIDALRLVLPESGVDWGAKLANEALEDIQFEHAGLPDRLQTIFQERWFPYICLAFQEQIKTDTRARRIFISLQIATGFETLKETIREFREENMEQHAETHRLLHAFNPRPLAAPVNPYASVRASVQNYVDRAELQDRLRGLLLGPGQTVLTALQGMGGIGKTELARKLCHDPEVREAFPDGIVWLDIGRDSGKTLLDRMKEVAEKLNGDPASFTEGNCETRYRSLLAGKAVLLVLDDVWSDDDVKPFIPGSPHCRLLFTTRAIRIAAGIGAADCTVNLLSDEQAREVLAKNAGLASDNLPLVAAEIIVECGSLPQGLAVIGSALRGKATERWADILEKLRHAEVPKVLAPTAVSVDELGRDNPTAKERYLQLAVLLEDLTASEPVLQTLWGANARAVRDTVDEFENRCLALREAGGMRIHNLQMDYVRSVYHRPEALPMIHDALRLSSHVVERSPVEFASQMVGRLLAYDDREGIREFIEKLRKSALRPWLRPLALGLTSPGIGLIRILVGHTGTVQAVAMSADGKVAISGSYYGDWLRVWDVEKGHELEKLPGHDHRRISGVAVSADGAIAVSASDDKTLKVWDLKSGRERWTLRGHDGEVWDVAVSADGKIAVSASKDTTLRVWDLESGRERRTLKGDGSALHGVAVSADGKVAVSASRDKTLKVWAVENGEEQHTLEGHTGEVYGVAVSADGRLAVSASTDRTLKVWDLESGRERWTLQGHTDLVYGASVSADGRVAVSASGDRTLKVWDTESGQLRETLRGHGGPVYRVAIRADGKKALSSSNDGPLRLWNLGESRALEFHTGSVRGVAMSTDGRVAVSASNDGTLKVWDVERGRERWTLRGNDGEVWDVALSADGKIAVSASKDTTLTVWDLESGQERRKLEGHGGAVCSVAVSADGVTAVSVSFDETMKVWDVESGQERRTLHVGSALDVAVSADGKIAISKMTVWDLETGHQLQTLEGCTSPVALTADGQRVLSTSNDRALKVWDLASGQERRTIHSLTGSVWGVAMSADGEVGVSASSDGMLKVWDIDSGACLTTFSCDGRATCCAVASGVIAAGDAAGRVYFLALEREQAARV